MTPLRPQQPSSPPPPSPPPSGGLSSPTVASPALGANSAGSTPPPPSQSSPRSVVLCRREGGEVKRSRLSNEYYADRAVAEMADQIRVAESRVQAVNRDLYQRDQTIGSLRRDLLKANPANYAKMEADLGEFKGVCADQAQKIAQYEQQLASEQKYRRQAEDRRAERDAARDAKLRAQQLATRLTREVHELNSLRNRDASTLSKAQESVHQLKLSLQEGAAQRERLQSRASEQGSIVRELRLQLDELQSAAVQHAEVEQSLTMEVEGLEAVAAQAQEEIAQLAQERDDLEGGQEETRGRKAGHRGHAALSEQWSSMKTRARSLALRRHADDIECVFAAGGADDWSPAALARVLDARGLLPALMGTYPFAKSRLQLVRQLRDVLTAEWNAELAVFVVTELELSARKYQKLRLALCKAHDEFWRKRAW